MSENSSLSSSKNRKWLLVATNDNWKKCLESKSWGVKERYKQTIQRMKAGDELLVHLTDNKTAGICKVTREYYYDTQPTWGDGNFYTHRIGFEPVKITPKPIDAKDSYDRHLRKKHGTSGGYFGNPIRQISDWEFSIFESDIDKSLANSQINNLSISDAVELGQEMKIDSSKEDHDLLEQAANKAKEQYQSNPKLRTIEKEVIAKYGSIFNPQNLDNLTAADFKSFLLYENNNHWKNIHRHGGKIVADMERLKSVLRELLDESKPIKERFDAILPKGKPAIKGLGRAILTPILLMVYPDRYSVFNEITCQALEYVGIYPDFETQQTLGEQYQKVNEIIKDIASKNALSLWQMDWVWWDIIEKKRINKNSGLDTDKPAQLKENYSVFLTGYDQLNLEISEKNSLLGWSDRPGTLTERDIVFVFDTTNHKIKSCFRILTYSNNKNPVWHEEISSTLPSKIIYPYRWNAELIEDSLNITTDKIFEFEPFRKDKKIFSLLIRNRHPRSLNGPQYDEFRNYLLSKCDNMKIHDSLFSEEQTTKYLLLRTQPGSNWEDKEGEEYHYGTNVPRHSQVTLGSYVIFDRNKDGQIEYMGCAKVYSVREEDRGRKTPEGRPIIDKVALLEEYRKFDPPVVRDGQIERMIESIPNYNNQHSIRLITKEIFELITKDSFSRNQRLAYPGDWFSLSSVDIEEVIKEALDKDGIRLEIEPDIVKRIINHLISSKNVILVGPPGTGKTDLARRLLRVLGKKIIGKEEPVEAVASYEWGRYEVIGGNSLSQQNGDYTFHYGCVTRAIKEGKFLLIDEFNRADMNKAFGEMFLAVDHGRIELREDERPIDLINASNNNLTTPFIPVPSVFRMICTMNDYDKSILNDLSYGLLRRFAFVEIDIPKNRSALKDMIIQRTKNDLSNLDNESVLNGQILVINEITEKFIDFVYEISQMRKLGVSTMLDVVRYIITGIIVRNEQNYWKLFNEAMIDYVLPQFDRLDIDTLKHVKNTSLVKFRTIDSSEPIPEIQPLLTNIEKMLKRLEELSDIFENK